MIKDLIPNKSQEKPILDKTHANSTQAVRELIRRALNGKIKPEDYLQAVQLIREHGDFNLGGLFESIHQIEKAEEGK